MKRIDRREVLVRMVRTLPAIALLPVAARAADACVEPETESLRTSLSYTSQTPDPEKPCRKCSFFEPQDSGSCGGCQMLSGSPVDAEGHCVSWSPKE
jgi:hypothetical protein